MSTFQSHSKASYEHQVPVKETIALIAGYQARRMRSSCLKDPNSLLPFEGLLKAAFGVRVVEGMNFF